MPGCSRQLAMRARGSGRSSGTEPMIAKRPGWLRTAANAMSCEFGSQPGGLMTAASTLPSSISAMASSGVKCVTCRCERLLGKPLPQRWIWASTICIACFLRRCGRKYPRIAAAPDKYETDDADRRGEHDVKTRRQVVAGHRDEPGRDKRGKTAEDRHCDGEAQRYADASHGSRKEF